MKKNSCFKKFFTLVETIVALAIMGISIAVLLEVSGDAMLRVAKAEKTYEQQHQLTQAVEFYMLANVRQPIDQEVFDLKRFDIKVNLLTNSLNNGNLVKNWMLKNLVIEIKDKDNNSQEKTANLKVIVPANGE